jgi:hypothetical protein
MSEGWNDGVPGGDGGDCRKLVTIEKDGMIWVGIRAWSGADWLNSGSRDKSERVVAWRELPPPAFSDGMMQPMPSPTLDDHRPT